MANSFESNLEKLEKLTTDIKRSDISLEEALKGNNIEDIKAKKQELEQVAQKLAQRVYEEQQKTAENVKNDHHDDNNGGQSGSSNDDVFDADYKEV